MTAQPVRIGDVGIDSSGARIAATAIHQNGGRFRIRYSAGAASDPSHPSHESVAWKLCGEHEIADAEAEGVDFVANDEWYESRVEEGYAAGLADGTAALKFWRSRGLSKGAAIYSSWDKNPSRLKWRKVLAYIAGFERGLKGYYHADSYAGSRFLRYALTKGVIRHGWRPNAGSWSSDGLPYQPRITPTLLGLARKKTPAAIWQTGNYWFGKQADENVVLRTPVGSHLEQLAPPPVVKPPAPGTPHPPVSPPPASSPVDSAPGKDTMLIVTVDRRDCAKHNVRWPGVFLLAGGRLTHVPFSTDVKALSKAGLRSASISLALYRNLGGK